MPPVAISEEENQEKKQIKKKSGIMKRIQKCLKEPFPPNPIATAAVPEGTKIIRPRSSSSNIFGPEKLLPKQGEEYFLGASAHSALFSFLYS